MLFALIGGIIGAIFGFYLLVVFKDDLNSFTVIMFIVPFAMIGYAASIDIPSIHCRKE